MRPHRVHGPVRPRLLRAGGTVVGKTDMEDTATGLGEAGASGAGRNALDPRYSPSGSAAAVASGAADIGTGAAARSGDALDLRLFDTPRSSDVLDPR